MDRKLWVLVGFAAVGAIVFWSTVFYIAFHFIAKFW